MKITEFFKLIGNTERLLILLIIARFKEVCVCELTWALEVSQPLVSRHLARMKKERLLLDDKKGPWKYYRLSDELPDWQLNILKTASEQKGKRYNQVLSRIEELRARATENDPCPL